MAKDGEEALALIERLVSNGQVFSVSVEGKDLLVAKATAAASHEMKAAPGDGHCIQWVYVPERGLVCVKHGDG